MQSFLASPTDGPRQETLQMFDILQFLLDRARGTIKKKLLGVSQALPVDIPAISIPDRSRMETQHELSE